MLDILLLLCTPASSHKPKWPAGYPWHLNGSMLRVRDSFGIWPRGLAANLCTASTAHDLFSQEWIASGSAFDFSPTLYKWTARGKAEWWSVSDTRVWNCLSMPRCLWSFFFPFYLAPNLQPVLCMWLVIIDYHCSRRIYIKLPHHFFKPWVIII